MKVVSVLNQKGGCGKTTISINLAHALQLSGDKVLLVDADPQASSRDWNEKNRASILPVVGMDRDTLPQDLALIGDFDWVVIDGAPRLTQLIAAAISVSDMVLIPVHPSAYDIWACVELVEMIVASQVTNKGVPQAAFVLSRKIEIAKTTQEAIEVLDNQKIPRFKSSTNQRVVYASTAGKGQTVFSTPGLRENRAAINEINAIKDEIIARLFPDSPSLSNAEGKEVTDGL